MMKGLFLILFFFLSGFSCQNYTLRFNKPVDFIYFDCWLPSFYLYSNDIYRTPDSLRTLLLLIILIILILLIISRILTDAVRAITKQDHNYWINYWLGSYHIAVYCNGIHPQLDWIGSYIVRPFFVNKWRTLISGWLQGTRIIRNVLILIMTKYSILKFYLLLLWQTPKVMGVNSLYLSLSC